MKTRSAFTLIEMLTVIAISAVLLTIIVLPIFQSFNLTRAAEAFSDAQDQARRLTEKISRDIGNAVSVRGTTGLVTTTLNGNTVSLPSHSQVVQVPGKDGKPVDVALPFTKLDIVPPSQIGQAANGGFVDPISGKVDPTLKTFKGQAQTPVVPSALMTRYSIGLRDPALPYNDPFTGILMARAGDRDNLYVLYRSTVASYVFAPPAGNPTNPPVRRPNLALFDVDADGKILLDDPRFMVADKDGAGNVLHNDHNVRIYHWLGTKAPWEADAADASDIEHNPTNFAHTVLQTEVSRYDMISPQYNIATHAVNYEGNVPRLTPLVQFRPTVVSNDPAAGQQALRPGEETENAVSISPDVFKTQYGLWNNAVIRTYPAGYLNGDATHDLYEAGYVPVTGAPGFSIFAYSPSFGGTEFLNGIEVFDTFTYDNAASLGLAYPFTSAASQSNLRSGWLSNAQARSIFTPYHTLSGIGKIIASYGISEVGKNPLPVDPNKSPTRPNLPIVQNDVNTTPTSALKDDGAGAVYSGADYDINRAFNLAWNTHTYLQPNIQRFIDLRVTPNEDGTYGPLYPSSIPNEVTGFLVKQADGSTVSRCRIVPGTDVVVGPDQNLGPNLGRPVRYTRVTHAPGPNQYRINYVDQREPSRLVNGTDSIVDELSYQQLGLTAADTTGFLPDTYDPANFVSATIQPRFKAGYVQLNSDPGVPLPNGYLDGGTFIPVPFSVDYRFQFTGTLPANSVQPGAGLSDVFAVDYDTRQLMQVLLTIRNYPQSNLPNPQAVTLKSTASIRNVLR